MLTVISTTISGIVSLREIRGHCIGGRDLMSWEVLTMDTKMAFLKTVGVKERAFKAQLLETQLFVSHFVTEVSGCAR